MFSFSIIQSFRLIYKENLLCWEEVKRMQFAIATVPREKRVTPATNNKRVKSVSKQNNDILNQIVIIQ